MKKDSENQLFFNFDEPLAPVEHTVEVVEVVAEAAPELPADTAPEVKSAAAEIEVETTRALTEFELYQAVLAHLVKLGASAGAMHVPCRQRKYKAPVAAYFSEYRNRRNHLSGTVVVDIYSKRSQCLPECAGSKAVARELVELKQLRSEMEEEIRIAEPHLRAEDELFDEFRSYNYSQSSNKEYHKLCRRIASLQQSLYKGTRMEQLAKAAVADQLIIAVPENMINSDEMPDNWGVWYILPDKTIREVKAPEKQECSPASQQHLLQNIGHAAFSSVLFANGIKLRSDGKVRFTRPPRSRRK